MEITSLIKKKKKKTSIPLLLQVPLIVHRDIRPCNSTLDKAPASSLQLPQAAGRPRVFEARSWPLWSPSGCVRSLRGDRPATPRPRVRQSSAAFGRPATKKDEERQIAQYGGRSYAERTLSGVWIVLASVVHARNWWSIRTSATGRPPPNSARSVKVIRW